MNAVERKSSVSYYEQPDTAVELSGANTIHVNNLTVKYSGKTALSNISVDIEEGKVTGIVGPNGAGKSTLIKGMMKLIKVSSGYTLVGNNPIDIMRKNIAYVEQRNELDLSFPINVFETVLLGTYPKIGLFKRPTKADKAKAYHALETVKMESFAKRQIGELSGGQLQRVFIARALAQETDIFLLDEPFVGIDIVSEDLIMNIIYGLRDSGKTIAIVHHDLQKVTEYFDNVIILNKNLISSGSVEETYTDHNISQAYGRPLKASREVFLG